MKINAIHQDPINHYVSKIFQDFNTFISKVYNLVTLIF